VRRYRKYQLPDRRKASWSRFDWVLVVLLAAAIGWVWWHTGPISESESRPPPPLPSPAPPPANVQRPAAVVSPPPPPPPTNAAPGASSAAVPRAVRNVFEAQLALERQGLSSGSIDGRLGPQTRAAIRAFQQRQKLPLTGELDAETKQRLTLASPSLAALGVGSNDLAHLQPLGATWLAKSQQTALDHETILEFAAEKSHAHPGLIRSLNPEVDWTNVPAGTALQVPAVAYAGGFAKAAWVRINLSEKSLQVFDAETNLLLHFPCSIAQRVEKRQVGALHVAAIAPNPNYTFDPEGFPESPEAQQLNTKLVLPPGPNNPVGTVWIGLDRPGYGIHGTPNPEQVGRTESHGCFRLANWNAELLLKFAWIGMPVHVEP
jgi:lipoprotein-anchoring transpeptidase ErfK/SrfK